MAATLDVQTLIRPTSDGVRRRPEKFGPSAVPDTALNPAIIVDGVRSTRNTTVVQAHLHHNEDCKRTDRKRRCHCNGFGSLQYINFTDAFLRVQTHGVDMLLLGPVLGLQNLAN